MDCLLLGMCKYADFNLWAPYIPSDDYYTNIYHTNQTSIDTKSPDAWFVGGVGGFNSWLSDFVQTTDAFAGIEVLALMTAARKNPRQDLPYAMIASTILLFVTIMSLVIVISSLPPGVSYTARETYPLNWGLRQIFNTDDHIALALNMPCQLVSGLGFIQCGSRLIVAFTHANLLPKFLHVKTMKMAVIYFCILSYLVSIVSYYVPIFGNNLANVSVMAAFSTYFSQIIAYMM